MLRADATGYLSAAFVCVLAMPAAAQRTPLESIDALVQVDGADIGQSAVAGEAGSRDDAIRSLLDSMLEAERDGLKRDAESDRKKARDETRKAAPASEPDDGGEALRSLDSFVDEVFRPEDRIPDERTELSSGDGTLQSFDWQSLFAPAPREPQTPAPTAELTTRDPVVGKVQQTTYTWAPRILAHRTLYFEDMPLERYGQTTGDCVQPLKSGVRFLADAVTFPLQWLHEKPCELHYVLPLDRPGRCSPLVHQKIVPK